MTSRLGREELRRRMREDLSESEIPITDDELGRWAAGQLADDERAELLDRLARHPAGIELWRVADRMAQGSERLRAELSPEESEVPIPAPSGRRRPRQLFYALAASWLVAALGLGLWWTARSEVDELRRERGGLMAPTARDIELLPDVTVMELDRMRGDRETLPVLRLAAPAGDGDVPLLLRLPVYTAGAVEIGLFDTDDTVLWSARLDLPDRREEKLVLLVRLPAGVLAPSRRHRLAVVDATRGRWAFEIDLVLTE